MTRRPSASLPVVFLAGVLCGSVPLHGVDPELERLKAAANAPCAALTISKTAGDQNGRAYLNYEFAFDTLARKYRLRYKSFPGADAALNPQWLNDWASGYGMLEPCPNWYHNGFLSAALTGSAPVSTDTIQGQMRSLATSGPRVGYDLIFTARAGTVVVRTFALAGREELFVSVSGKANAGDTAKLVTRFRGYPCGFRGPFDRWLHGDGLDLQNAGSEKKTVPLTVGGAPWLLLADHRIDPGGTQGGLLGLIYDPGAVTAASMTTANYSIDLCFEGPGTREQRFMVYTFGPMTWETARQKLAAVRDAEALVDNAFRDPPSAVDVPAAGR